VAVTLRDGADTSPVSRSILALNELSSNIAGHRTSVVTDLKLADGEYDIITDINMAGKKPVHMEAMFINVCETLGLVLYP
jgi:hypothetical protein